MYGCSNYEVAGKTSRHKVETIQSCFDNPLNWTGIAELLDEKCIFLSQLVLYFKDTDVFTATFENFQGKVYHNYDVTSFTIRRGHEFYELECILMRLKSATNEIYIKKWL